MRENAENWRICESDIAREQKNEKRLQLEIKGQRQGLLTIGQYSREVQDIENIAILILYLQRGGNNDLEFSQNW
jgi:hypothetical protein